MKTFKDENGRDWEIVVNVDAARRVRDILGVNIASTETGGVLESIAEDPILLCDLLYVLCKPQADAAGVSDEQFGQALAGDAIDRATTAFLEALVDFFPSRRRAVLRRLVDGLKAAENQVLAAAEKKLSEGCFERAVDRELAKLDEKLDSLTGGPESGRSPEASDSTPAPSH